VEKPILLKIVLKKGSAIDGARLQLDVPKIPGFLAIESQSIKHATDYIALDNIASFSVIDYEAPNIRGCFVPMKVTTKIER